MKLLVTGCTGFIGLHLTRMLLAEGHEVVGLVRDPAKLPADVASRIETLRGDLGLFRQKDLVLPRVDVVVHLAAVIAAKDEAEYVAVNFQAVEDLLAALRRQTWSPRRFVFASSLAAAGPNRKEGRHSEDDDTAPIDPYGIAKRDAEQLMRAQPFPTTSFRPPVVLGAGDPASLTLYKMARSGFAFLPAGAAQRLSFVGVHDLCRAILAIVNDSSENHRVYSTTSETEITNRELLQSIARAMKPHSTLRIVPVRLTRCSARRCTCRARRRSCSRSRTTSIASSWSRCSRRRLCARAPGSPQTPGGLHKRASTRSPRRPLPATACSAGSEPACGQGALVGAGSFSGGADSSAQKKPRKAPSP